MVNQSAHALDKTPSFQDGGLLADIKKAWQFGDWAALVELDLDEVKRALGSSEGLVFIAAAYLQVGQFKLAKQLIKEADPNLTQQILLAGVHNNLAAANALADNASVVFSHYQQSVQCEPFIEVDHKAVQQRMLQQCNSVQAEFGFQWTESVELLLDKAHWIVANDVSFHHNGGPSAEVLVWVQHCINAPDLHAAVDDLRQQSLRTLDDVSRLSFYLALASALVAQKIDKMTALSYVQLAKRQTNVWTAAAASAFSEAMVNLGQATLAAEFVTEMTLKGVGPIFLHKSVRNAIDKANIALHQAAGQRSEHGHDLLLSVLGQKIAAYKASVAPRKPVLVEIGTTREDVPGQGSTRKITLFCKQHGIGFVTVDMDPHNSLLAREMFHEMGLSHFQAITMKGEDYLRQHQGVLDFVFLDAYDFDHGNHSEIRQSRYEQFLGARIDELQCHQMHLDCAESVLDKLTPNGLVCVDDTWLDNGKWTAKGTLAVPFLLANGFTLLEARNRAALLGKT